MEIYFDESGRFHPNVSKTENFSFVMGIIIPEGASAKLKEDFDWFVSRLTTAEFKNGEPKGSLLTLEHRKLLLEIMKSHRDVMLVPVTVNLGQTDPEFLRSAPQKIRTLIESNLGQDSPHMKHSDRKEFAKRISNLSPAVLARILAYAIAVLRAVEAITSYYACEKFHRSYDPIKIVFDRVVRPNSREELVFRDAVFGYIANWTSKVPLKHDPSLDLHHPLGALYGADQEGRVVLDLKKMLLGKIDFEESRKFWQIRLADFLVSIWSRVISDHSGTAGHQSLFRDLHAKTSLDGEHLLGVVALTDNTEKTLAPSQLNVFRGLVSNDAKILPCG
jgi:hypothetical protein